jgi:glycosyltransferase involved in cell wall biosynthesis
MSESVAVAVDVTPMAGARTGIGRSVAELVSALEALPNGPVLRPYALGARTPRHRAELPDGTRIARFPTRLLLRTWSHSAWPQIDRVVRGADVVHATNYLVPVSRLPTIVTINDCAFVRFPETVSTEVRRFLAILRRAVARGVVVHATTHAVAAEIDELFGPGLSERGRLVVVPWAIPQIGDRSEMPDDLDARIAGAPFVLAIGTLEPRKNLPRLVQSFGALASTMPDVRLVIAGQDGPDRAAIDAATSMLGTAVRERVVLAGRVSDATRRALLERAGVLAYPSIYEGFGFPMLEAMTLGTPVVAADAGAIPEVADGAARLVDPFDVDAIAGALRAVLADESVRSELVAGGARRAGELSWRATAEGLSAVYSDVRGRSGASAR